LFQHLLLAFTEIAAILFPPPRNVLVVSVRVLRLQRELLDADEKSDRYYQAVSRIRRKINEELTEDVRLLEENHPDLLGELRDVVCEEDE
jgi:hypothetical protein